MYDETKLKGVGACIRNLRAEQELTQFELAEKIGVSQTHLSNIECGRVQISLKLLLRIANVLECPLPVFLDTQAALDWGKEQAEKTASEQEEITETYTLEEVRQLLQHMRRPYK